ncbi:DUF2309 domain-containing protein [Ornithinibacillus salinisoli]|uniref:Probable inorganic carbon transporter subunit DabA n=1 Tax=Ornithinibacillus salinisoli TaxID=1848459 RepID=A0ABW4VZZ6_9BACI
MNVTSAIPKESVNLQKDRLPSTISELNISVLVKSASHVIAPLWPISTFAARNPWMGLENQPFDEVATWLKETRHVDIYPSSSMLHAAKQRGEINHNFIDLGLQQWIDSQSLNIPREVAEEFCRSSLQLDELPDNLLSSPEIKSLAEKASNFNQKKNKKYTLKPLSYYLEQQGGEKIAHTLDYQLIKWCKLYLDESEVAWGLPNREKGFYYAWRSIVEYDPGLSRTQRNLLKECHLEPESALKEALVALDIPYSEVEEYLKAHLLALPGWAGMMLWRSQQSTKESSLLTEYLAVRLTMEWVLMKSYLPLPLPFESTEKMVNKKQLIAAWIHWGNISVEAWSKLSSSEQNARLLLANRFNESVRRRIWWEAWEKTYENQLSKKMKSKKIGTDVSTPPLAQFIFCIDVRSEPFRRQLEKTGPFETYGMAGFFGLPIETSNLGSQEAHPSLPVILKPQHRVKESSLGSNKSYQQRLQIGKSINYAYKTMKQNLFASLLLPEVSGPWLSLKMIGRSFAPRGIGKTTRRLKNAWLHKPQTELTIDQEEASETELTVGFSDEEKVNYVRQALKTIGLTSDFSPLVVICGHGSHSTNNPYASALDCGACGGASGEFNARVLATLCNLPKVRKILGDEGIWIPEDTVFVAAEHITTIDELRWHYVPELSSKANEAFLCVNEALPKVVHHANAERLSKLPNLGSGLRNPKNEAERFAEDWSQVRPEWGLARNASFVIGRRTITKGCDLEGRAFLHDYDWTKDEDGSILANIIAGPGTVTQWINLQYYSSTVAPYYYGSGNKATQTVTSGIGIMQGNASDLLTGLPWQSVMQSDDELYHSPLRLLVVIEAPRQYVKRLLENDPIFYRKVKNGWLRLANVDSEGNWQSWSNQEI